MNVCAGVYETDRDRQTDRQRQKDRERQRKMDERQ